MQPARVQSGLTPGATPVGQVSVDRMLDNFREAQGLAFDVDGDKETEN
jgi:hypothetical protein